MSEPTANTRIFWVASWDDVVDKISANSVERAIKGLRLHNDAGDIFPLGVYDAENNVVYVPVTEPTDVSGPEYRLREIREQCGLSPDHEFDAIETFSLYLDDGEHLTEEDLKASGWQWHGWGCVRAKGMTINIEAGSFWFHPAVRDGLLMTPEDATRAEEARRKARKRQTQEDLLASGWRCWPDYFGDSNGWVNPLLGWTVPILLEQAARAQEVREKKKAELLGEMRRKAGQ